VYAKFRCAPLRIIDLFVIDYIFVSFSENKYDDDDDDDIKKALGIFGPLENRQ